MRALDIVDWFLLAGALVYFGLLRRRFEDSAAKA
jgi:hypothetical protein